MKLYKFNMSKNGHNIDGARTFLRLRWYDANDAGDYDAADRLQAFIEHIDEITGGFLNGMIEVPYKDWELLHDLSEWYKSHRAESCAEYGIEYVE